MDYQRNVIEKLNREYAIWNSNRRITPEMKKREDALRDVIKMLNTFDETIENLDCVEKCITNLHEVFNDIMA